MKEKTLRDEIAIDAMRELIRKIPLVDRNGIHGEKLNDQEIWELKLDVAISAYRYADAMLEIRDVDARAADLARQAQEQQ